MDIFLLRIYKVRDKFDNIFIAIDHNNNNFNHFCKKIRGFCYTPNEYKFQLESFQRYHIRLFLFYKKLQTNSSIRFSIFNLIWNVTRTWSAKQAKQKLSTFAMFAVGISEEKASLAFRCPKKYFLLSIIPVISVYVTQRRGRGEKNSRKSYFLPFFLNRSKHDW